VIEGLFNILKNKFGLAHTRHRSVSGGFIQYYLCIDSIHDELIQNWRLIDIILSFL